MSQGEKSSSQETNWPAFVPETERENLDQNLERSTWSTRSPDVLLICPEQQIKALLSSLFSVCLFTV